jgi:hypothetical protein
MNSKHISSYMNNTKKILHTLLAIVAFTVPILCANPSQSLSNYPSHAHPFRRIGSSYSQSAGDAKCRDIYASLTRLETTRIPVNVSPDGTGYADVLRSREIYDYSGVQINGASHVWYHQQNGECVANIGKY